MTRLMRIGLTGGIASGKSTVAQRFIELGVPVIDADESAREVVAPGKPGLTQVVDRFGIRVLTPDGALDRRALRDLIFSKPACRRELEAILHPLIRDDMDRRAKVATGRYLVLAIPLLIESEDRSRIDRILVVDSPEEIQIQRVIDRDGCEPVQARAILAAQASRQTRLLAADDVLLNSGTVLELRKAVDTLHESYLELIVS